jgi:hypothetical protein
LFEDPGKTVRIVAFFVAGVVLSVAGALIYATVQESRTPVQVRRMEPVSAKRKPSPETAAPAINVDPPRGTEQEAANPDSGTALEADGGVSYATVPIPRRPNPRSTFSARPLRPSNLGSFASRAGAYVPPPPKIVTPVQPVPAPQLTATTSLPTPPRENIQTTAPSATTQTARKPEPHTVTLPTSTELNIKLLDSISTDRNRPGDLFRGTLESPITRDGFVIADRGSLVYGRISSLAKPHWLKGTPDLILTLIQFNTTDGQSVHITTNRWEERGRSTNIEKRAKRATENALGALKNAIARENRSQEANSAVDTTAQQPTVTRDVVSVPRGTQLTFLLDAPVTLREHLNDK